jgi:glutaredoxin
VARALTLYTKPGCHLCGTLRDLLEDLAPDHAFTVQEIDITTDPALQARYRLEIPVLAIDGIEVVRGRIDEQTLVALLEARG